MILKTHPNTFTMNYEIVKIIKSTLVIDRYIHPHTRMILPFHEGMNDCIVRITNVVRFSDGEVYGLVERQHTIIRDEFRGFNVVDKVISLNLN